MLVSGHNPFVKFGGPQQKKVEEPKRQEWRSTGDSNGGTDYAPDGSDSIGLPIDEFELSDREQTEIQPVEDPDYKPCGCGGTGL